MRCEDGYVLEEDRVRDEESVRDTRGVLSVLVALVMSQYAGLSFYRIYRPHKSHRRAPPVAFAQLIRGRVETPEGLRNLDV